MENAMTYLIKGLPRDRFAALFALGDEELAAHGIHAAGFKTDADCADMGRVVNVRRTK